MSPRSLSTSLLICPYSMMSSLTLLLLVLLTAVASIQKYTSKSKVQLEKINNTKQFTYITIYTTLLLVTLASTSSSKQCSSSKQYSTSSRSEVSLSEIVMVSSNNIIINSNTATDRYTCTVTVSYSDRSRMNECICMQMACAPHYLSEDPRHCLPKPAAGCLISFWREIGSSRGLLVLAIVHKSIQLQRIRRTPHDT